MSDAASAATSLSNSAPRIEPGRSCRNLGAEKSKVVALGTQVLNGTRPPGSDPYATDSGFRRRIPLSGARSAEAAGAWSVPRRVAIAATDRGKTEQPEDEASRRAGLAVAFGAIMLLAPWFAQAQDDNTALSAAFNLDSLNPHARKDKK